MPWLLTRRKGSFDRPISGGRAEIAGGPTSVMLPKGFSRNQGELAIALREETSRRGRLEANGTDEGSILRPYSACEGWEPQGFGKERPRYPLEGREEKRTDLPKET